MLDGEVRGHAADGTTDDGKGDQASGEQREDGGDRSAQNLAYSDFLRSLGECVEGQAEKTQAGDHDAENGSRVAQRLHEIGCFFHLSFDDDIEREQRARGIGRDLFPDFFELRDRFAD